MYFLFCFLMVGDLISKFVCLFVCFSIVKYFGIFYVRDGCLVFVKFVL